MVCMCFFRVFPPQIVFFLVTYVGPMVGLSVTYCQLGSVLWAAQQPRGSRQANKLREERRKVCLEKTKVREEMVKACFWKKGG